MVYDINNDLIPIINNDGRVKVFAHRYQPLSFIINATRDCEGLPHEDHFMRLSMESPIIIDNYRDDKYIATKQDMFDLTAILNNGGWNNLISIYNGLGYNEYIQNIPDYISIAKDIFTEDEFYNHRWDGFNIIDSTIGHITVCGIIMENDYPAFFTNFRVNNVSNRIIFSMKYPKIMCNLDGYNPSLEELNTVNKILRNGAWDRLIKIGREELAIDFDEEYIKERFPNYLENVPTTPPDYSIVMKGDR